MIRREGKRIANRIRSNRIKDNMTRSRQDRGLIGHGLARTSTDAHGQRLCLSVQVCVGLCLVFFATIAAGSIQSPTVPQSSYRSGLVRSPNPIDTSSNLPITGNVQGGKHFRGDIPYSSPSAFQAPLGSTSLDSFLRYSAVPQTRASQPQNYTPFYSSTGSVTTTVPGYQGVFSPTSPRIVGGLGQSASQSPDLMAASESALSQTSTSDINTGVGPSVGTPPSLRYGTLSRSPEEMRGIIAKELGGQLGEPPLSPTGDPLLTPDEYRQRLEQLRQGVEKLQNADGQPQQDLGIDTRTTPTQTTGPQSLQQSLQEPLRPAPPLGEQQDAATQPEERLAENLRTVPPSGRRLELYDPSAANSEIGLAATPDQTGQVAGPLSDQAGVPPSEPAKLPALQRIEETSRKFDTASKFLNRSTNNQPETGTIQDRLRNASKRNAAAQDDAEPNLTRAQSEALQQSPAGQGQTSPSSGSLTQDQFNHYLAAGRLYLRQGRYYRAADSFTLASVYIPHDPRAHLGSSHALLAAGEYVSSAASLARAIDLDAQHALQKVDLVETLGGPDLFVERISSLEERAQGGDNTTELQFLLAYVYLQMDRPDEARNAIQAVKQALPSSPAVNALSAAIDPTTAK